MGAPVGYSVSGWLRGWIAPCAVCTWHVEMRSVCFLVEPQNQGRQFVCCLASKPLGRFSPIWPQNRWQRFLVVWHQNRWSVSRLSMKTKVVEGFPVWASKSPRQFLGLGIKTKQASVCRLRHKTDGGRSTRDTRRDLAACFTWKQFWLGFSSQA
jgi:hypothetical protein